jgi:hypothetical protein
MDADNLRICVLRLLDPLGVVRNGDCARVVMGCHGSAQLDTSVQMIPHSFGWDPDWELGIAVHPPEEALLATSTREPVTVMFAYVADKKTWSCAVEIE